MRQNGFIKLILLIIIILAVLSYFGIKISSVIENDVFQENFNFVWNWCKNIWNNYLIVPASYFWNDVIVDLLWEPFIDALQNIKDGDQPDLMKNAPSIEQ